MHASITFRSGSGSFSVVPSLNDVAVMLNEGGEKYVWRGVLDVRVDMHVCVHVVESGYCDSLP